MSIKQLFCKHIYKLDKEEYLYTTTKTLASVVYTKIDEYAIINRCIKCNKIVIFQQSRPHDLIDVKR